MRTKVFGKPQNGDPKKEKSKKGDPKKEESKKEEIPPKGTEEYYDYMAKRNRERYKKGRKKVKELGSGKLKKNPKTKDGGVGAYTAQSGGGGCVKGSCKPGETRAQKAKRDGSGIDMKAQKQPKGRSFQTGSKDLGDVMEEQHKKDQKILKGEGGGSEGYKKMAREKTAQKVELRDEAKSIREEYAEKMKDKPYEERMKLKDERDAKIDAARSKSKESNKKSKEKFRADKKVDKDSSLQQKPKTKRKVKKFTPKPDVIKLGKRR